MSVTVYVEGGGVGVSVSKCRKGFRSFFERLLPWKNHVTVIACGGRNDAFKAFKLAYEKRTPDDYAILWSIPRSRSRPTVPRGTTSQPRTNGRSPKRLRTTKPI